MSNFRFSPRPNRAHEINWREWDDATFAQAQREDKPILLDISGVWCHWCHVMDETSYSDPEVIQLINERFVPIRVDTDQRPDVNRRYNLGGWPTTAFLTPEGELLTGGTYIAPPQLRSYLLQVSETYKQNKADILDRIRQVSAERAEARSRREAGEGTVTREIVEEVARTVLDHFDSQYGGFGTQPKFPHIDALELALERYYRMRAESFLLVITKTLTNMAGGGMYDSEEGGFFRYSTTRDWSIPHFEKMIEDHAKLLPLYSHAYQVTRLEPFLATIKKTLAYIDATMTDHAHGGYYGTQDADEEYYARTLAERSTLSAPYVDKTFYTDWNAMMASAYFSLLPLELGSAPSLGETALKTLDRIWSQMYRVGVGILHFQRANEEPQVVNLLSDLAYTIIACLDAFQHTGSPDQLTRAQILADLALEKLYDSEHGAFFSEPGADQALGMLRVPDKSLNENAAMARALIRLYRLTESQVYHEAAQSTLAFFANDYERYSFTAADYARAVEEFLHEPLHVRIVGKHDNAHVREFQETAMAQYSPGKLVQLFDPARDEEQVAELGYPIDGSPTVFVCVGTMCLPPVKDTPAMLEAFQRIKNIDTVAANNAN